MPIDSLILNDGKTTENLPRYKTISEIIQGKSYINPLVVSIIEDYVPEIRNLDDLKVLNNLVEGFQRKNDLKMSRAL